jgi:tRNA(Ile)-lysidine synthase
VVDHGLREASAEEARLAVARLGAHGIAARLLTLTGLHHGTALAERARTARYRVLEAACAEAGILHLLLGHHRADQAETVLMRQQSGSGPDGLAGMAALIEKPPLRLLRPLLDVPPVWLRDLLRSVGLEWTEDPSNTDPAAQRARLRAQQCDPDGTGPATASLAEAAEVRSAERAEQQARVAEILAARVRLYPEGFAVLSPGALPGRALAALLRTIGGAGFPPSSAAVNALAAAPRPATLGGVRLLTAGRLGPGLLVVREAAAMAPPINALSNAVWDRRFRLLAGAGLTPGTTLGALGADTPAMRTRSTLPAVVLATMPALRVADKLVAVPHLCYRYPLESEMPSLVFAPAQAAAPALFVGADRVRLAG